MGRLFWLALLGWQAVASAAGVEAIVLSYEVREPGIPPYLSRTLVTPDYLRMDDGVQGSGFVLFDRQQQTIYSVAHDEETVFVIPNRPVTLAPPEPIVRTVSEVAVDAQAPTIGGLRPAHQRLLVNGEQCFEVVAVAGLVEDAVVALQSFRRVLAGEHALLLPSMPADLRDPCDLALHTFFPTWQLEFGLPIQSWGGDGGGEVLTDYAAATPVEAALFMLPAGYRHYSTDGSGIE